MTSRCPAMLWASFVRSPEAHAKIVSIDSSAAAQRPGIRAVFTGADMADIGGPLPMAWAPPGVEVNEPAALATSARRGQPRW